MGTATIRLTDKDGQLEMQTTYEPAFDPANHPSHDHADTLLRGLAQIAEPVGEPVNILMAGDRRQVKRLPELVRNADGQVTGWKPE